MNKLNTLYKKAIVTGGAGFIGSHLVEELLNQGIQVISIDDYSGGKSENLQHLKSFPGFTEIKCDITNKAELEKYFSGVDIIFHEAVSKMTLCLRDPQRDLEVNAQGTLNLLELSRDYGIKKFIHASTGSVYGEAHYYPTDENHPVNPASFYGVSKLAGEKYVGVFNRLYGLNTTVLRYFHVYGPRQENSDVGGVASIFARRALENKDLIIFGDGTQIRSFTYVKDVVRINIMAALLKETNGQSYNCASGVKITISELANKVLTILNKQHLKINYQDWKIGDIKVFDVSNDKLKSIGMKWEVSFDEGLRETLEWSKTWVSINKGCDRAG